MKIYRYYFEHFDQLTPNRKYLSQDKQFHFATRIKNWSELGFINLPESDLDFFRTYLKNYAPSGDIATIYNNNDFSGVNSAELRRPFFEKYSNLYGLEGSLFYVHHLGHEFGLDLRPELLKLISEDELRSLAGELLDNPDAVAILSSYAANVLCLLDLHFFKVDDNLYKKLIDLTIDYRNTHPDYSTLLFIYLITHIIICDSGFYSREVPENHRDFYRNALKLCEEIIALSPEQITLDTQLEFLVCARLVDYQTNLKNTIASRCELKDQPFITDPKKSDAANTFSGAEHRNVLYIMAGLDEN